MNNHGCHAEIGDFVEVYNPMGEPCGYALVVGEREPKAIVKKRLLHLHWLGKVNNFGPTFVKDSFVRIVSRVKNENR